MVVVDASAVLELLKGSPAGRRLAGRYAAKLEPQAPHLIDGEVLSALRRWTLKEGLEAGEADDRLELYRSLAIRRHAHGLFLRRAWLLRENLSAFDALYVALAEGLDVPLVTADGRLSKSTGHKARVELL